MINMLSEASSGNMPSTDNLQQNIGFKVGTNLAVDKNGNLNIQ